MSVIKKFNEWRITNPYAAKYMPLLKFILIYTLIFLFFKMTFYYCAPFLLGFLFAVLVQPVYIYMRKKLSFRGGFAATVITTAIFIVILGCFCWIAITIVKELISLITFLNQNAVPLSDYANDFIGRISHYLGDGLLKQNTEKIFAVLSSSLEAALVVYNYIWSFITFIPAVITMFMVSIFSTYYFTHDLDKIKSVFSHELGDKHYKNAAKVFIESSEMIKCYMRAYMLIYFLTFLETLFTFLILKIKYPIFLAVLMAISDILPIIGPGAVYIPLIVIYLITGDLAVAIALLVSWLLISIIRQFIEPKIVSNTVKIHPLLVLTALYFSLLAANLWVFFYFLVLFLYYQVLIKVGFITPILNNRQLH